MEKDTALACSLHAAAVSMGSDGPQMEMNMPQNQNHENLGPAERIIQALLSYTDHLYHGRPGMIVPDGRTKVGVRWEPVTHKVEEGNKVVYLLTKQGKKTIRTRVGLLQEDGRILDGAVQKGIYRPAGLFPEVAAWMYRQVAEVWKLDNEFAARWASYAFGQEHRDLKVVLAAFMLCQSRKGDPVKSGEGKVEFFDDDFRDIGEAMILLHSKQDKADKKGKADKDKADKKESRDLNPKLLLRIHDLLTLPEVAAINRELGFGRSARKPFLGRWEKAVEKWLRYREQNPKILEGLVQAGYRTTVMDLARHVGYKPETAKFFWVLRWKQAQTEDGRRGLAIGAEVKAAETWEGLSEEAICQKITKDKPNFKRIVGLLPKDVGLTRAIVAAAIDAGSLSSKDLIIATPTLEELGLLQIQEYRERWEKATKAAEDMRAANIASRVKSKEIQEKLQEAADTAAQKAVEEVMRDMRVYVIVDISGSMEGAIEKAKQYITKFLPAFPLDHLHVSVFNSSGREVTIKHASAAGVENAFRGIRASGSTSYGEGVRALSAHKPKDNEDTIFVFFGDEEQNETFERHVEASGLRPMAFGFVKVQGTGAGGTWAAQFRQEYFAVRNTAARLGIPCVMLDEAIFNDAYAVPRTLRNLIAATPVGVVPRAQVAAPRLTLVDTILKTPLLQKPAWAAA